MKKSQNLLNELAKCKKSLTILSSKDLVSIRGGRTTEHDTTGTLVGGSGLYVENELE